MGCEQILRPYDLDKGDTWTGYKTGWAETGLWIIAEEDGRNSCSDRTSSLKGKTLVEDNRISAITRVVSFSHVDLNIFPDVNLATFLSPLCPAQRNCIYYHNMNYEARKMTYPVNEVWHFACLGTYTVWILPSSQNSRPVLVLTGSMTT